MNETLVFSAAGVRRPRSFGITFKFLRITRDNKVQEIIEDVCLKMSARLQGTPLFDEQIREIQQPTVALSVAIMQADK